MDFTRSVIFTIFKKGNYEMGAMKEKATDEVLGQFQFSRELRAVITILAGDSELVTKALPHIDMDKSEINWEEIFKQGFSDGRLAALSFAKAIWDGKSTTVPVDPFEVAPLMDAKLKGAIPRAIAIRWELVA